MTANIQYGVSTWLWTSPFKTDAIEPLFKKVADLGFDAIEIALEDPSQVDNIAVKKALDKYHLKPIVCGAFGSTRDLTHEDPAIHEQCFQYINRIKRAVSNDIVGKKKQNGKRKQRYQLRGLETHVRRRDEIRNELLLFLCLWNRAQ